jgi:hypothetical protein
MPLHVMEQPPRFFAIAEYGIDIQIVRPEMTKFKTFRVKVNMDIYFVGITF